MTYWWIIYNYHDHIDILLSYIEVDIFLVNSWSFSLKNKDMGAYPGSHYTFYLPINLKPLVLLRTVTNMLFSPSNTPLHIKHKTIRPSTHNTQSTQVITSLSQTIDHTNHQTALNKHRKALGNKWSNILTPNNHVS